MPEKCNICLYQPYYNSKGHFPDYFDRFARFLQYQTDCNIHGVVERNEKRSQPKNIQLYSFTASLKRTKRSVFNNLDALHTLHSKVPMCKIYHFLDVELLILFLYLTIIGNRYRDSTIVITQHSTNSYKNSAGKCLYKRFIKVLYKLARKKLQIYFITNGRAIGEDLKQFFDIPASNIQLSEWGADTESNAGIEEKIPKSFLVAGILRKDKGLEFLADVLPSITEPMKLTIAGYPMDYSADEIWDMFSSLPDYIEIEFKLDYLENSVLSALMKSREFLIIPYKPENKSSSGPLIQGLLNGMIPIVSNYGERARIVNEHASGISFDYSEISLKEALHDALQLTDESKKKMGLHNRDLTHTFSWDAIFRGYTKAYEKWSNARLFEK